MTLSLLGSLPAAAQGARDRVARDRVLLVTDDPRQPGTLPAVTQLRRAAAAERLVLEQRGRGERFTDARLSRFDAVVFANTTGNFLSAAERAAFERFYRNGGGVVAVGTAIDAEPDWEFMTNLLGARATGWSNTTNATVKVADRVHPAGDGLPQYWQRTDRFANFDRNVRGFLHVLATVDENTYDGGDMGHDHPIAWCQDYEGGRSFYVGSGANPAAWSDQGFLNHLLGAIEWAAGGEGDCGATVLANYEMTVIGENLVTGNNNERNSATIEDGNAVHEPIGIRVLPDGRVLQTTRAGVIPEGSNQRGPGEVRLHDPEAGTTQVIAQIPVYNHSEDGLYGPGIDNNFEENNWVYLFYAPVEMEAPFPESTPSGGAPNSSTDPDVWDAWRGYFQLSRFQFVDGPEPHLDMDSEQQILKVPVQRGACCHVAGDIVFDSNNNLIMGTGDDTPAGASGWPVGSHSPRNDGIVNGVYAAPHLDARRTSGNTNDLMGKILRIHVEEDGTYTIPEGNLFEPGTPLTRPEIYAMGLRNPFRNKIGPDDTLYVTDYSNDTNEPDPLRGPPGTGQFIVMDEPGNYGWPFCEEPQLPYMDWEFDPNASSPVLIPGEPFDCANLVNESRFNTGLTELPPTKASQMWYARNRPGGRGQQTPCPDYYLTGGPENDCPNLFPEIGGGNVAPHGALPYTYNPDSNNPGKFPEYYDGSIFFGEFTRNFLKEIRLNDHDNEIFKINDLLNCSNQQPSPPQRPFICNSPMDMDFHDGEFYLLTYGQGFFNASDHAKLVKFSYTGRD